jgi:integrase
MASLKKRGKIYYAQYYVGARQRRVCLHTCSLQIAKDKLRKLESSQARGDETPLPTRTPIADILTRYVEHIRSVKTPKSAQTDIYYLRSAFGPICDAVSTTSRHGTPTHRKRPVKPGQDQRCKTQVIEASCFEQITTAEIASFIGSQVRSRGLAPKTANRFREIICRLFNWAMTQGGIRMPADKNPGAAVERYREKASQIRFLTLAQITEQLDALEDHDQLQTMVALFIYAGLRREEALWLQHEDIDLSAGANGMIRIRAKEVDGNYWQPKTARNRAVPISRALRGYLNTYTRRLSVGGWYFPSPKGVWYDPDNFSSDLARVQKAHRLRWTCLDFRHTFGSQLAMKGESLYKISALMGNSPEICRRHYAALLPEALTDTVEFDSPAVSVQHSSRDPRVATA